MVIDQEVIQHENSAEYLGLTLDAKLRWTEHVKKKRTVLDQKFRKMFWLLGRHSECVYIINCWYINKSLNLSGHMAVSYTHLDVYKRQVL